MPKETFECNSDERDLIDKFDAKLVDYVKQTTETLSQNNKVDDFINALSTSESNNLAALITSVPQIYLI